MKILILLFAITFASCSKNRTCYECTAVSGGNDYKEKVCTDGDPKAKLQQQDSNGTINWGCVER